MPSLTTLWAAILLLLLLYAEPQSAQFNLPPVACADYFQYLSYAGKIIGKITVPNIMDGTTRLGVKFSQREPLPSNYYGSISLFNDQQTTLNNIENGQPVSYRVDFPIDGVAPKLIHIDINGYVICSASQYTAPSTVLELQHTLQAGSNTVYTLPSGPGGQQQFLPNPGGRRIGMPVQTAPQTDPFQSSPDVPIQRPPPVPPPQQQPRQQPGQNPDSSSICGQEGSSVTPFIHGGDEVKRGQYPWMIPIYMKLSANLRFICGGSLLSSRTIITAGHCFALHNLQANQVVVYVGRYKLDSFTEDGVEPRELSKLEIHPEYSASRVPDADIAILHISQPVTYTQYIRPICLWTESADDSLIVGKAGVVAGWGADELGNSVSSLPKWVSANIVREADCLRMDGFRNVTTDRTICAGNLDGTGPCNGDSGGGLMLSRNGRWTLRGIVSVGQTRQNVCNLAQYVIYCDLAKHRQWIERNMLP